MRSGGGSAKRPGLEERAVACCRVPTRAAGHARRRQWVQACVPYACACKCLRVRACLQPHPRPGMRMPEPHLQTLGTHPLGIVAPKLASLGLPFQRQCFDFHRLFSSGSAPRNHLGSFPQLQDRLISILQIIWPSQVPLPPHVVD